MLTEVADGVWVRQSAYCLSNAIAVRGAPGVLLVDPGVDGSDLEELADELERRRLRVVAGFSTHPHWDHLLWHRRLGDVPRYTTARSAQAALATRDRSLALAREQAPGAPLDLLGRVQPLAPEQTEVPWDGPPVRLVEHEAHAPGHAAVVLPEQGVLLAADMLSDVEIPLLDPRLPDQVASYGDALDRLEAAAGPGITVLVPGHGSVARGGEIGLRLAADRAYVEALRRGEAPVDRRLAADAEYGRDWLPDAHRQNLRLAGVAAG